MQIANRLKIGLIAIITNCFASTVHARNIGEIPTPVIDSSKTLGGVSVIFGIMIMVTVLKILSEESERFSQGILVFSVLGLLVSWSSSILH